MAEIFPNSFSAEGILMKAASLANEPLSLAWRFDGEIGSLHKTLSTIRDITRDAAEQPQDGSQAVEMWSKKLEDVAHDADDVLDEISYKVLLHKQEIQNHMKKKVLNILSLSKNPILYRFKMARKIQKINASLVALKNEAANIGLKSRNIDAALRETITGTLPQCYLEIPPEDECWSIFKNRAFPDGSAHINPRLEIIGREIAKKCSGVQLVARVLGSMLRYANSEADWLSILKSNIWDSAEGKERIILLLELSFHHLKLPFLKHCFAYCSMFKKDSELERDNLMQLWMAQGFLDYNPENNNMEMEDIGNEYFNILLERSLFEDLTEVDFGIVAKCRMHDLVHDLAERLSKYESSSSSNEMDGKLSIRHAAHVPTSVLEQIPERKVRRLHSLFLDGKVPSNMLPRFNALHVLNLYKADIEELPGSIGQLKQLRYLNVSTTAIKALPKSIGKLQNLQTLRMQNCRKLKVFPKEVQDLVNLRHIYFDDVPKSRHLNFGWYRAFPFRIGKLTNLRTVPYFIVGQDKSSLGIEELNGLSQLKGELTIYDLEHVRDGKEAKKANLVEKTNIRKLTLVWGEERRPSNKNEEDVLDGLTPHSNLEILEIHNFMGARISSWIQLSNLKRIRLLGCDVCEEVPVLGFLPNLVDLEFDTMTNLKRLGAEFDGYKALFPVLKTLRVCTAPNLVEWMVMPREEIVVFPCLEELALLECPQLKNVSNQLPFLRQLEISMCHELSNLASLVETCISLQSLVISSCESLTSISMHGLTCLRKLVISSCGELTSMELQNGLELYAPVSLEELSVSFCRSLESFPTLHGCTSLRELTIAYCDGLKSILLSGIGTVPLLEKLTIRNCASLESFPSLLGSTSLRELTIADCDRLMGIGSNGIRTAPLLEKLTIRNCASLESFPTLLGCTSLRELTIADCDRLMGIVSSGVETLPLLKELTLRNCPSLDFIPITQSIASLPELVIEGCPKMKISVCNNLTSVPVTPSLLELAIEDCAELSSLPTGGLESLQKLSIGNCSKLTNISIHSLTSLRKLVIASCGPELSIGGSTLEELSLQACTSLRSLGIKYCQHLRHLSSHALLQGHVSLEVLAVIDCPNLEDIPSLDNLTSLRDLRIWSCNALTSLPSGLLSSTSLTNLSIESCHNLVSMAHLDVSSLQSLSHLKIMNCGKLKYLPTGIQSLHHLKFLTIGKFLNELDCFLDFEVPSQVPRLHISGWPKLKSLPQQIQHLTTSVSQLSIEDFSGLETIPEWLGNLASLNSLVIERCENLMYLPTVKAMQRLTRLQRLVICYCPLMNKRCAKESGSEWPKISHIPDIQSNYDFQINYFHCVFSSLSLSLFIFFSIVLTKHLLLISWGIAMDYWLKPCHATRNCRSCLGSMRMRPKKLLQQFHIDKCNVSFFYFKSTPPLLFLRMLLSFFD